MASVAATVGATVSPSYAAGTGPRVLVIGDSLTARAADRLARVRPGWTVDGVRGRNVRKLPAVLGDHLERDGAPDVLVIALGTNEAPEWTREDYAAATQMVPPTTRIVFVTCYRDPVFWGERDTLLRDYSRWMGELVKERPLTGKVTWRQRVSRSPELLVDGVHATEEDGERAWVRMVTRGVDKAMEIVPEH